MMKFFEYGSKDIDYLKCREKKLGAAIE